MNKIVYLLLPLLFSSLSIAQWRYLEQGNEFDGKIRVATVVGSGTDYPYNKPKLVLNYFVKDERFNLYIDDSGYFVDFADVTMIFDKEPSVFYMAYNQSISADNKTIFIDEFYINDDVENRIGFFEVLEKLKLNNRLSVRVENKYGKNDIRFNLSGSTKAINLVSSDVVEKRNKKLKEIEERKEKESIIDEKNKLIYNKLYSIAKRNRSTT